MYAIQRLVHLTVAFCADLSRALITSVNINVFYKSVIGGTSTCSSVPLTSVYF